jgi:heme-degrading monooxygenase HmoA
VISQFFEVQIKEGQTDRYLGLAASLKPSLEAMGGCLFIDRFRSLSRKNLLLSYQIWQDEGSMVAWRVDPKHHTVQEAGREKVFDDYRIRISQVVCEERPGKPAWRPERLSAYNDPRRRPPTSSRASTGPGSSLISWTSRPPTPASTSAGGFSPIRRPSTFVYSR